MTLAALGAVLALAAADGSPIVVFPPDGGPGSAPGWIGSVVAETLPRALQRASIEAVPNADRLRAQEALGVGAPATTRATAIRVAEALGASRLVVGSWELHGGEATLSLRLVDGERGSLSAPFVGSAPLAGLAGLVHSLAWDIALAGPTRPMGTREALVRAASVLPFEAVRALGEGLAARDAAARIAGARRALGAQPAYEEAVLALGRLLVDANAFADARAVLAGIAFSPAFAREARFLDAVALLGLARFREADVVFAELARERPSAAALADRALARLRGGSGGASVLLREAVEAQPASVELPFNLGQALLMEGDAAAAAFWLRGAVQRDPGDAEGRLLLSWALAAGGRAEEADEQWKAAFALSPALKALRSADLSRRIEKLLVSESGLVLDPERLADAAESRGHAAAGEELLRKGDVAGAVSELARAALLDPYAAAPHHLLARAHRSQADPEKAVEELRTSLWCRDDPVVRGELAELLRSLGRSEEARRIIER